MCYLVDRPADQDENANEKDVSGAMFYSYIQWSLYGAFVTPFIPSVLSRFNPQLANMTEELRILVDAITVVRRFQRRS